MAKRKVKETSTVEAVEEPVKETKVKKTKTVKPKVPTIEEQASKEKELLHKQILDQREFFKSGTTKSIKWRLTQLSNLYSSIKKHESEISEALKTDLNKSEYESYITEIGFVLQEISIAKKNLKKWAKPKKVPGDFLSKPAKGCIVPEPMGTVLIISTWSNPFLLSMQPMVSAIASGDTVVLKSSESSPATSKIIETIVQETFPPEYILFLTPGFIHSQILLGEKFDFIFFTGSKKTGQKIIESAAKYFTPVCMELGGKNPCIVDESANLTIAAKRIVWGKLLNAGQSCVAPDYLLVQESIKKSFIKCIKDEIELQYGTDPLKNPAYPKIVSPKHFARLFSMVPESKVDAINHKIEPTLIDLGQIGNIDIEQHPTMKEEIFGPIFPIISFSKTEDVINYLSSKSVPLCLYLFSQNKVAQQQIVESLKFGSGCLNDVVYNFNAHGLPFGGMGESGMGHRHGEFGFKTFSHYKPILIQDPSKETQFRYEPDDTNLKKIKKLLK